MALKHLHGNKGGEKDYTLNHHQVYHSQQRCEQSIIMELFNVIKIVHVITTRNLSTYVLKIQQQYYVNMFHNFIEIEDGIETTNVVNVNDLSFELFQEFKTSPNLTHESF